MNGSDREEPNRRHQLTRRDLLRGKLGLFPKLPESTAPVPADAKRRPVMRYPRSADDVAGATHQSSSDKARAETGPSINGISIAPVQKTGSFERNRRLPSRTLPVFRPPGAIAEQAFLDGCTRCGECIKACPYNAIVQAPDRLREAAGTPVLDPDTQPCLMCDGFPCIKACEPGVLIDAFPKMMGTARVTEHLCLAHHDTPCTACSEHCPVDKAIAVTGGKPTVREDVCTGCGVCRHVCPAPANAVLLMPIFARPDVKEWHDFHPLREPDDC